MSSVEGKPGGNSFSTKPSGLVSPIKVEGSSTPGHPPKLLNDVNRSLQSWLDDDNIIVDAPFPENLRCVIAGPVECGKIVLLKYLIILGIYFDRVYIIGPTGDQYDDLKYADIEFVKDIKDLPPPDQLPKDIKKLKLFDDVGLRNQLLMNTSVEADTINVI